jgi:hypothetical protein
MQQGSNVSVNATEQLLSVDIFNQRTTPTNFQHSKPQHLTWEHLHEDRFKLLGGTPLYRSQAKSASDYIHAWAIIGTAACALGFDSTNNRAMEAHSTFVPKELQTVKASISEALSGFIKSRTSNGILIYKVKGWDYAQMCEAFEEGISISRNEHIPVLFHVEELTQPQGHSTSGSHERYKSAERLQWETEFDCVKKFKEWILSFEVDGTKIASEEDLVAIEKEAKSTEVDPVIINDPVTLLEPDMLIPPLPMMVPPTVNDPDTSNDPDTCTLVSVTRNISDLATSDVPLPIMNNDVLSPCLLYFPEACWYEPDVIV